MAIENNNEKSATIGLSHVALSVPNVPATREFFEALGFREMSELEQSMPNHSLMLTDGFTIITLWQLQESNPIPFDRRKIVGLHHLSIRVRTLQDLDTLYEKASLVKGVTSEFAPAPLQGTKLTRAMLYEPCGIRVELTHHGE